MEMEVFLEYKKYNPRLVSTLKGTMDMYQLCVRLAHLYASPAAVRTPQ